MRDILSTVTALISDLTFYFNPVGKLYLKYQLIFRVLFVGILLSDIFGGEKLVCDTSQVGCTDMCVNRFAPITFKKLWELELWLVLIVTGIFIIFVYMNKTVMDPSKYKKMKKYLNVHEKKVKGDKVVVYSKFISMGYMVMLVIRIFGEFYFLRLEYNLAVHQSGKTGFQAFMLPEKYHCLTHIDEEIEVTGRKDSAQSKIFYIDEPLEACSQSRFEVPCWIPNSRMKQKGLIFMYGVLIVSTVISFIELLTVMFSACCKRRRIPQQLSTMESTKSQPPPQLDDKAKLMNDYTNNMTVRVDPAPMAGSARVEFSNQNYPNSNLPNLA